VALEYIRWYVTDHSEIISNCTSEAQTPKRAPNVVDRLGLKSKSCLDALQDTISQTAKLEESNKHILFHCRSQVTGPVRIIAIVKKNTSFIFKSTKH